MDEEKFKVEFKSSIKKLDKICQRIIDYKSIRAPSLSLLHLIIFIACENSNDAAAEDSTKHDSLLETPPPPSPLARSVSLFGTPKSITVEDSDNLIEKLTHKLIDLSYQQIITLSKIESPSNRNLSDLSNQTDLSFFEIECELYQNILFFDRLLSKSKTSMGPISSHKAVALFLSVIELNIPRLRDIVFNILKKIISGISPEYVEKAFASCNNLNPKNRNIHRSPDSFVYKLLQLVGHSLPNSHSIDTAISNSKHSSSSSQEFSTPFGYGNDVLKAANQAIELIYLMLASPIWVETVSRVITDSFRNCRKIFKFKNFETFSFKDLEPDDEFLSFFNSLDEKIIHSACVSALVLSGLDSIKEGYKVVDHLGRSGLIVKIHSDLEKVSILFDNTKNNNLELLDIKSLTVLKPHISIDLSSLSQPLLLQFHYLMNDCTSWINFHLKFIEETREMSISYLNKINLIFRLSSLMSSGISFILFFYIFICIFI